MSPNQPEEDVVAKNAPTNDPPSEVPATRDNTETKGVDCTPTKESPVPRKVSTSKKAVKKVEAKEAEKEDSSVSSQSSSSVSTSSSDEESEYTDDTSKDANESPVDSSKVNTKKEQRTKRNGAHNKSDPNESEEDYLTPNVYRDYNMKTVENSTSNDVMPDFVFDYPSSTFLFAPVNFAQSDDAVMSAGHSLAACIHLNGIPYLDKNGYDLLKVLEMTKKKVRQQQKEDALYLQPMVTAISQVLSPLFQLQCIESHSFKQVEKTKEGNEFYDILYHNGPFPVVVVMDKAIGHGFAVCGGWLFRSCSKHAVPLCDDELVRIGYYSDDETPKHYMVSLHKNIVKQANEKPTKEACTSNRRRERSPSGEYSRKSRRGNSPNLDAPIPRKSNRETNSLGLRPPPDVSERPRSNSRYHNDGRRNY